MKDFTNEFPVLEEYTYLNTPSSGLVSTSLIRWRHEHDLDFLKRGSLFRDGHKELLKEIRKQIADFFKTDPPSVAMLPNFSFGMNSVLDGIPRGKKILLLEGDYPSINWPVEQRDFEVCYAALNTNLEDNIEQAISHHKPEVFAFSLVQYISGIAIDLDFLAGLKHRNPDLVLIADGTQFLGTTNFNFSDSPIDVLGASGYKWLLGGYGNGFFLAKEEARERILPKTIGYNSLDASFGNKGEISFIGRLEPGHQDTLNYGSLAEALRFLQNIGMDEIEKYVRRLNNCARQEFIRMDLLDDRLVSRATGTTIFNLKGDRQLFDRLRENGVICSMRGDGLRVGFHVYNTEQAIEKLLQLITRS